MGGFFANVWTKRAVSLLSPIYCAMILVLSYFSIFYEMIVRNPVSVCVMISAISLIALVVMLYTRRQVLTVLTSLVMLPGLLPAVLFFFGHWEVLIPPLIVALIIFFFSGLGETPKTIFGTAFLLLYLLGSLMYFLMTTLFAPSTVSTTVYAGTSPSGIYRYEVINTADRSDGNTTIYVETSELDRDYDMILFQIKGLTRTVVQQRPLQENITVTWQTEKRSDITAELQRLAPNAEVTLSDRQMELLGRTAYEITYNNGQVLQLTPAEYHALMIELTAADQAILETDKESVALNALDEDQLEALGISVVDFKTVLFSSLTDAELETLGVPAEGDVMYYNGKVCFRYYIAILEEYFDISKQELGLT